MGSVPDRRGVAAPYRAVLSILERRVPLPNINPAYYHTLALALSILYLYVHTPAPKIAIIAIVLVTDWLDGATARRYGRGSRAGYIIDVVTDRASEAFIFAAEAGAPLGQAFFLLWIINSALAFYSVRTNTHTALPLRFAYLIILIVQSQ
jgi:phosphatidylglycerophosphate synthase